MTRRAWPDSMGEMLRLTTIAKAKYRPLVDVLSPAELVALSEVTADALAALRVEAGLEDIRRGHRPPGTRIGR